MLWNIPQLNEGKLEDQNMRLVGLGNITRISTDHACPKISMDIGCRTCG